MTSRVTTAFEQHAQTGVQLLILAVLGWAGLTIQSTSEDVASLNSMMERMERRLETMMPREVAGQTHDEMRRRITALETESAVYRISLGKIEALGRELESQQDEIRTLQLSAGLRARREKKDEQ